MIEGCRLPGRSRVARLASLREAAAHVIRIRRALEIFQVTGHARRAGQVVIIVDVAVGALARRHGVTARQQETCGGVIEAGRLPSRRGVALQAIRREIGRHVVRIGRALEILQVTRHAARAGQVVVVVRVAIRALPRRYGVTARQQETCSGVIELSVEPVVAGMARVAGGGKLCGDVIGIGGGLKVFEVAGSASRRHRLELAVGRALVAGVAVHGGVRPSQRKSVIVLLDLLDRNLPSAHRVTSLAIRPQLPLVNIGMAILAALPNVGENRFDVALGAGDRLVHPAQRIARPVVIEFWNGSNRLPPACGMTILAGNDEVPVRTTSSAGGLRLRCTRVRGKRKQRHCNEVAYGPST